MRHINYLFILIIFSIFILKQCTNARGIPDDAIRNVLYKQFRKSLEEFDTRRVKRDTECPEPYHGLNSEGNCVWSCSEGTTPDNNSNECICQPGLHEVSTDQFGRRICACQGPYHVLTPDNRCVWSCSQGTTPDTQGTQCICQPGLYETSTDQFGRRICTACQGPYHVLTSDNRCVWSCSQGTTPDNNSGECICQRGLVETSKDQFGRRICTVCPGPYHVLTSDNRCVWSCSEGTTPDEQGIECICQRGLYEIGHDRFGRRVCGECKRPYHVLTADKQCVWSCPRGTVPDNYGTECISESG